ncbi:uncharacterized protein BKA55DRAFT_531890 [Fusarium redolens]|uniref:Uncharacterized protein n=1 Tax=Fusarium redolens TaxID=48865 RepID=A0A9P9R8R5_FUSRE|nr:uncharacterized protein BKA55DRAFT_531890 [Fusarium redolens]KAH7269230.1 hypothetical protein BKA55DRAFT_531890 [Fusarium redolens]
MAPIVKLALTLTPVNDTLTWMKHFIQTTTASQHHVNGKGMYQSLSDGAAWLHGFFERREDLASLLDKQGGKDKAKSRIQEVSTSRAQEDYVFLVRNFCFDRAFIITMNGRIGIGPSNTCKGDTVPVILGGGVPYIIRASGKYWNLVGESYVDGLMEGEAIESYAKGMIQEEVLRFI